MKLYRPCFALAVMLLAVTALAGRAQPVKDKPPAFSPGETLTYDVNWSLFPAGKLTATLSRDKADPGDSYAYVVTTTAQSQGFVSLLYKVQDRFRSVFNPETLCSIQISKQINEGRRHKNITIIFNRNRGLAILEEHDVDGGGEPPKYDENEIPPCVQDIVTAFYYVRSQHLRLNEDVKLAVNDGSKTKTVVAAVTARKKIQTPLGVHEALRVEPAVFGNLYEQKKGKIVIWFSDDAYHLPLRIRVSLKLGAITGTLTSVSPLPPGYSPSATHAGNAEPDQDASDLK